MENTNTPNQEEDQNQKEEAHEKSGETCQACTGTGLKNNNELCSECEGSGTV